MAEGLLPDSKLAIDVFATPSTWTRMPDDPMQVLIVPVPDGPDVAVVIPLKQVFGPCG